MMTDQELVARAIEYKNYLENNGCTNVSMYTCLHHVLFDDRDELTQEDIEQMLRVASWDFNR